MPVFYLILKKFPKKFEKLTKANAMAMALWGLFVLQLIIYLVIAVNLMSLMNNLSQLTLTVIKKQIVSQFGR